MSTTDPVPAAGHQSGLSVSRQTSPGGPDAAGAPFGEWQPIAWRHNVKAPWEPLGNLPNRLRVGFKKSLKDFRRRALT